MTIARGLILITLAAVLAGGCSKRSDNHHHADHHHADPENQAVQQDSGAASGTEVAVTDVTGTDVVETGVTDQAPKTEAELLADWMCGKFSSEWQYEDKPEVYFNLRSYVTRIWPDRSDGPWLYAETGVHIEHMNANAPFSQRIYQLVPSGNGEIAIRHFEFREEDQYDEVRIQMLGAWRFKNPLAEVTLEQLKERDTCAVYVRRTDDDTFAGRTRGKECIPNNDYVVYAVFERWFMEHEMRAWDRGFSEGDIHLVGPVDGPYIFEKTAAGSIVLDADSSEAGDARLFHELPPATTPADD